MGNKTDILIRNGLVYDGTLSPPLAADIGIADDRIAFVEPSSTQEADLVIDASGLVVAPGFIDVHAHSDFTLVADPRAEGKLCQGVTTEINGNCGMSAAPLYRNALERREDDLRELGISERWNTLDEYFRILERRGLAINIAMLAGHGNIRGSIVGYEDRPPSGQELREMCWLLGETIGEGALGLSTGLIYPPGVYSDTSELVDLSRVLREHDLLYASHMRSEGSGVVEAVEEVIRIGREAGVRVHASHIKTSGEQNWQKAERVIELMENALRDGVSMTCDRYPYTASSTDLDSLLPAWTYEGGSNEEIQRLKDAEKRGRIAREMEQIAIGPDYWQKVVISEVASEKNRWMEGKTIAEISRRTGESEIDTVFGVLVEERLRVGAIFLSMSEENLGKFLSLPFCMIGSDSSARSFDGPTRKGKPHPRGFGTFPRLFGRYVRDRGLLSLSDALYKATGLAAETFGLRDRGRIAPGMYADLVVFDSGKINDGATFDQPFRKPEGVRHVLVNGTPAVREGELTGGSAGMVLRRGG